MKYKSVYIIILIFAAISVLILVRNDSFISPSEDLRLRMNITILDRNPEDIFSGVFRARDSTLIEFQREGEGWLITKPIKTRGSEYSIDNLIEGLTNSITVEVMSDVEDLEQFGLENPRVTIILYSKGSAGPDTIMVGDKAPTNVMCYTRVGSSRNIVLTNEITNEILDKTLFHFRDKKFLKLKPGEVTRLRFEPPHRKFSIEKSGEEWRLEETEFSVKRKIIDDYLESLNRALIYRFVSNDGSDLMSFGLDSPEYAITVYTPEDSVRVIFGTRMSDKIYARKSDLEGVILVGSDILEILDYRPPEFIELKLTRFEEKDISRVAASLGSRKIEFLSNEFGWIAVDSLGSRSIRSGAVQDVLSRLKALNFIEIPRKKFDTARFTSISDGTTLTFMNAGVEVVEKIFFERKPEGTVYAGSLSSGFTGPVNAEEYSELLELLENT